MKKKFDYALILLSHLKRKKDDFVDIRSVAEESNIPRAYLEKVAQELKRAGWLEAREGAGGGYRLVENPEAVSIEKLIDFYEPISSFCPVLRKLKVNS